MADIQDAQGAERQWYNEDSELGSMSSVCHKKVGKPSPMNPDGLGAVNANARWHLGDLAAAAKAASTFDIRIVAPKPHRGFSMLNTTGFVNIRYP